MHRILHGENTSKSRTRLVALLDEARSKGLSILRLEAKSLTVPQLEEGLGSQSLFGEQKCIVIEELHSLQPSQRKKDLIALLAASTDQSVILWEKRSLTKTMLKPFAQAQVEEFALSNSLFAWLDSLAGPQPKAKKLTLLHDSVAADSDYFCFVMLIRQIRLLIQAKENAPIAGPPFMKAKLQKQAGPLTLATLRELYSRLLVIDVQQKTSGNRLSLAQELDLLTLEL